MRENFASMRVSVRMYQLACVSHRMRETWNVCKKLHIKLYIRNFVNIISFYDLLRVKSNDAGSEAVYYILSSPHVRAMGSRRTLMLAPIFSVYSKTKSPLELCLVET